MILVHIGPHPSMEGRGQDGGGGENDGDGGIVVRVKINDVEHR